MGAVKIAEDVYQNNLQFAHLNCIGTPTGGTPATNLTTSVVWNTSSDVHVVITPISADAYVNITSNGVTTTAAGTGTGDSLGKFIPFGGSYTTIIRKNERISASATVNVVELGEI